MLRAGIKNFLSDFCTELIHQPFKFDFSPAGEKCEIVRALASIRRSRIYFKNSFLRLGNVFRLSCERCCIKGFFLYGLQDCTISAQNPTFLSSISLNKLTVAHHAVSRLTPHTPSDASPLSLPHVSGANQRSSHAHSHAHTPRARPIQLARGDRRTRTSLSGHVSSRVH